MADHETSTEALDARAVETRSELAQCIAPSTFPADREALLASVPLDAPEWVPSALQSLPDSRTYENLEQIWEDLGGERF